MRNNEKSFHAWPSDTELRSAGVKRNETKMIVVTFGIFDKLEFFSETKRYPKDDDSEFLEWQKNRMEEEHDTL